MVRKKRTGGGGGGGGRGGRGGGVHKGKAGKGASKGEKGKGWGDARVASLARDMPRQPKAAKKNSMDHSYGGRRPMLGDSVHLPAKEALHTVTISDSQQGVFLGFSFAAFVGYFISCSFLRTFLFFRSFAFTVAGR